MPKKEITSNPYFWSCECRVFYVHRKENGNYCPACKAYAEKQPDSAQYQVDAYYSSSDDKVIQKEWTDDGGKDARA